MKSLLKIENLKISFDTHRGEVQAVQGVSLEVEEGEVLAIVGESGCGKRVTAQSIIKLNPTPPARIKSGTITLCGHNITTSDKKEMSQIRGKLAGMIFQDPVTCLDPTMKIGSQLTEALRVHQKKMLKKRPLNCLKWYRYQRLKHE